MTALSEYHEKRNLLELLAYLFCEQNFAHELGFGYVGFGLNLYRKILKDLECQQQIDTPVSFRQSSYTAISNESRKIAELVYAEKTLEMIEKRVLIINDYVDLNKELEKYMEDEEHLHCKF